MAVIFNSVKTVVESVGRRRSIRKWNTLDTLECLFTGPTATIDNWIPKIGAPHPQYATMICEGSELIRQAALVSELRTTYTGKYYDMGPVAAGSSTHLGELSYTNFDRSNSYISTPAVPSSVDGSGNYVPGSPAVITYEFISYSWVQHYSIKTQIYKMLSRNPAASLASGGGSYTVQATYRTGRNSASNGLGVITSAITYASQLLDSSVSSLNNGWFEISETWGPQPIVVTTVKDILVTTYTTTF